MPFSSFTRRGDYQPGGAPTDGQLDLVAMWGYSMRLPAASGTLFWDDVQVYGTAPPRPVRLATDQPVYPVNEKGTAEVRVSVTTATGGPLPADLAVGYRTGTGTATPGQDYTPVEGTLTFPAGTASGATKAFTVKTLADGAAEVAETIPIELSGTGTRPPAETPAIVINAHGLPYLTLEARQAAGRRPARPDGPEEKVGQMTQAERGALGSQNDIADLPARLAAVGRRLGARPTNTPGGVGRHDRRLPAARRRRRCRSR